MASVANTPENEQTLLRILNSPNRARCDHSAHDANHTADQPASLLIHRHCHHCGSEGLYLMCQSGWDFMAGRTIRHRVCCGNSSQRDDSLTVIARRSQPDAVNQGGTA